ncbi:MAG TPA: ATP-dependent protease subunit HslV [Armatimonadota bacterium]|jgi:ATP-dependent HslUV protease subunit HslV|nr:ATP-dependent protease subunit HslV [Armatimonadota bacterium]HOJ19966.1 ATP-dependent protease subunit HslV [Armatimonadota bacterium]HOM80346.1 ATP-dependent protease subunit HslV [Armatimonadota bacterium]HOQ27892.1 ATP-dependent protease subunit HslV [Armatimonadota bacterium]HPO71817.1 ATP-dependent protease subunit HslV [Armatimonadota bacterium]
MKVHHTTIVCVRRDGKTAIAGDGQVTFENTIMKQGSRKVQRLAGGKVLAGYAGAAADALTLMERLEAKLDQYAANLERAGFELVKEWRTDRVLRRLEALLVVADERGMFVISGGGDMIRPDGDVIAVGSGGGYALAAARALMKHTSLSAEEIAREALGIAASICVYTNENITVELLG